LLIEQGYEVIGVYILGWLGDEEFPCHWQAEEADARAVAEKLNIPFYTLNLSAEYKKGVIDDFIAKYRQGLTPNPDVLCNSEIKFQAMPEMARQFEPDFIATGHYAKMSNPGLKDAHILVPEDKNKDQTYFLWRIKREILPKVLFPLGDIPKDEVRRLAKKYDLPTAKKKDSQGVCFIGPLNVRKFLAKYLKPQEGEAVLKDGRVVAKHQGAAMYTIGQRLASGSVEWTGDVPPLFVIKKDLDKNQLLVGPDRDVFGDHLTAGQLNWHIPPTEKEFACDIRIRYRQVSVKARVILEGDRAIVRFTEKVRAITPGQSVVFYQEGRLLGGGVID
jgi:tRNA-specific 2-thiouridylase